MAKKNDATASLEAILDQMCAEKKHGHTEKYWTLYRLYILTECEQEHKECNSLVNDIPVDHPDFVQLVMQSIQDEGIIFYSWTDSREAEND